LGRAMFEKESGMMRGKEILGNIFAGALIGF
jgi:hypothetical protein